MALSSGNAYMERILTTPEVGKRARLRRIFSHESARIVIVPLDDSLIAGPINGLKDLRQKLSDIVTGEPNAVIGYVGLIRNNAEALRSVPFILNLTASTIRSSHTRKSLVSHVKEALRMDAVAAAVHVNVGSRYESLMLRSLGIISEECHSLGMPLLAIMYPRTERGNEDDNYDELKNKSAMDFATLVAHAARIGVEMGADVIKTQYTGDIESYRTVVNACYPVPLIAAGGPLQTPDRVLTVAYEIVAAGGAGISFGRKVFNQSDSTAMVRALRAVVQDGMLPKDAWPI